MTNMQALVYAAFAALAIYLIWQYWSFQVRRNRLVRLKGCEPATRYPHKEPFLGLDFFYNLQVADAAGHRSPAYLDLHKKYGSTFEVKAFSKTQVETAHAENIQAICTTQFEDFGVEPFRGNVAAPFMDRGVFMNDGEYWKQSRALIRPIFNKAGIADLDYFELHVARFLKLMATDGETFDVLPFAKRLFVDSASEFIFGRSTNTLVPNPPKELIDFMAAFDRALLGTALTFMLGPLRWFVYIDPYWIQAYKTVHRFVDSRIQQILQERKACLSSNPENKPSAIAIDEKKTKAERYVLLNQLVEQTQDPRELRNQIINIFSPTRDTTALAFGNILFYLSRNPSWYNKVRSEAVPLRHTHLTYDVVRSLKTIKAIVTEANRLHPAVSRLGRAALKDTTLPRGGGADGSAPIFVAKGTLVQMDVYCVQHDRAIWGEDADEFNPQRWLREDRPAYETKWQYEPFLGGIRMCPAQNQVVTQLAYLLVRWALCFERMECRDQVEGYFEKWTMTVESRNGVKIAVWRDGEGELVG